MRNQLGKSKLPTIMFFRFFLKLPRDDQGRPCSASGMFATRRVKSFQEILRNVIYKFQCRLNLSQNELVKSTLFNHIKERSKLRDHWNKLLNANEPGYNQTTVLTSVE